MALETGNSAAEGPDLPETKHARLWLVLGVAVSIAAFIVDLATPRGFAAGVFPHFLAIGLSAFASPRLAPYALALLASIFTLVGYAFTEGGVAQIVLINRVFLVVSYWMVAFLVHLKLRADYRLANSRVDLEQTVRERTRELSDSEKRLRLITDRLPALVAYIDADHRYRFVNVSYEDLLGVTNDRAFGRHLRDVLGDDAYKVVRSNVERVLSGETVRCAVDLPVPQGLRSFRVTYRPDQDADGTVVGFVLLALDVTEEQDLQRKLEQTQKLEAVGQLSGGIAHDFNNLLGVIIGNLELALPRAGDDARRFLEAAMHGADRGASLTHRLLAFARRQPLRPSVVDLSDVLSSMEELLVRALGEQIEIEVVPDRQLWPTLVDAHQFESAILNLALNARDAMSEGGKLTIQVRNHRLDPGHDADSIQLEPGDYVAVSVTDSGCGMSSETRARVFEPFFTTKGAGEGSGMGLPMVYGFASQSGGTVTIYSEQDEGTTLRIYLPRAEGAVVTDNPETLLGAPSSLSKGERVLLVEDDPDVQAVVTTMLEQLNFRVEACRNGEQALELLANGVFDLLLTDIVLPGGMNGSQLAEIARVRAPAIAVVYMSGYTAGAVIHQGRVGSNVELLEKPFRLEQLARAIAKAR